MGLVPPFRNRDAQGIFIGFSFQRFFGPRPNVLLDISGLARLRTNMLMPAPKSWGWPTTKGLARLLSNGCIQLSSHAPIIYRI